MTINIEQLHYRRGLHPFHGVLLSGMVPLFLGAFFSDLAYYFSYQIQWSDFASWLIVGGLVFAGFAIVWAIIDLIRIPGSSRHARHYMLLLVITWVVGFINALTHARDAWAVMPMGLVLSLIVAILACISTWIGFSKLGIGDAK